MSTPKRHHSHARLAAAAAPPRVLSPQVAKLVNNLTPKKQKFDFEVSPLCVASPKKSKLFAANNAAKEKEKERPLAGSATPRLKVMKQYDRYIPNRHTTDMSSSHFHLAMNPCSLLDDKSDKEGIIPKKQPPPLDASQLAYQEDLARACGVNLTSRILSFQPPAPLPSNAYNPLLSTSSWSKPSLIKKNNTGACHRRRIQTHPERVLDAPGIADDYYLNLLDWSCDNNLAVALEGTVYVWNGDSGNVVEFCKASNDDSEDGAVGPQATVCSVQWTSDGGHLAVGVGNGDTQIWDLESQTKIRTMRGHTSRVGVLAWDRHIVSSGCKDGTIWHHDVRVANHKVGELIGHTQEVCGLKWRADGGLLASGGNDNLVNIWDARSSIPKSTKSIHNAAVKAVAWCPWQLNLLATGGGTNDKHIHFWNTATPSTTPLNSINTGSQVTSLLWSKTYKELVSSHGYPYNQLSIWAYPSCKKIVDLEGHDARVLHAALSPDGSTVVTGASDENLKFWKAFERPSKKDGGVSDGVGGTTGGGIGGMVKGGPETSVDDELVNATKRMTIR